MEETGPHQARAPERREADLHHIGRKKRHGRLIERSKIQNDGVPGFASLSQATTRNGAMHPMELATQPILLKPLAKAGLDAASVKQTSEQWLQWLADGLAWVTGFVQAVWIWSADQIAKMTQAPWESWPLWKQILLLIIAALVIWALFVAVRQLWWAALNVLSALASFIGTLIVTLPTILLAGAIALAGLWLINNFHDLSSLRNIVPFPGNAGEGGARPGR